MDNDVKTFDLAGALSGRTYPREVVPVFFDQAKSYELSKMDKAIARDPQNEELEAKRNAFIKEFEAEKVEIHLVGVPRQVRKNIIDAVKGEFTETKNAFGMIEPNDEADEAFVNRTYASHIEKIVAPDGAVKSDFTEEDAKLFRAYAPDEAIAAVEAAIDGLTKGAKSGYETAVQDIDFLSRP